MREFLKGIALFEELTDDEINEVSELIEIRSAKAGEVFIRQDEPVGTLFLLKTGCAKVVLQDETEEEEVLAVIQDGEVVGELGLIDRLAPSATVAAEEDLVLYAISYEEINKLMGSNVNIGYKILRALAKTLVQRLRDTDQSLSFARLLVKFTRESK